jgi:hypothetical protein
MSDICWNILIWYHWGMGTKGYMTYLLYGKVGIIPVVQSTLNFIFVHIFVSKINWLVFNANFSNISAISWRVFVLYITYLQMYNYSKVELD